MTALPGWAQVLLYIATFLAMSYVSALIAGRTERKFEQRVAELGRVLQYRVEAETEIVQHILLVIDDLISSQPQIAEPLEVAKLDLKQALAKLQVDDKVDAAIAGGSLVAVMNAARAQHRFRREHGGDATILDMPDSVIEVIHGVVRKLTDEDIARIRAGGDIDL